MGWLLIVLSLIVLWIASLFKILHTSTLRSKTNFLHNDSSGSQKKNVLLVIAHPDDESMFFSPTINYLISRGHNLYVLCLSSGNADGMGNARKLELYKACAVLKVPLQQVKVLDNPDLQDGFGQVWDYSLLGKIIQEELDLHGADVVITFDNYGVSGHCNHCDVHYGVRKLIYENSHGIEAWELVSINILRKYSGPIDIWLSMLLATKKSTTTETHCLPNEQPGKSFQAMKALASQWVWFRKIFVSFSSYTYTNTLRRISREIMRSQWDQLKA